MNWQVLLELPILAISISASAAYQVSNLAGDKTVAEAVAVDPQNTDEFIVAAEIVGNESPVFEGLVVNDTASFNDFTLSFPTTCPQDVGADTKALRINSNQDL